jgi:hypothetical protein
MKITDFKIKEKSERWDDPGVYPSGAGGSALPSHNYYQLKGYADVTIDTNDLRRAIESDEDQLFDEIDAKVKAAIKDEFGNTAANSVSLKTKKIKSDTYRVEVYDCDSYKNENISPKSLKQLLTGLALKHLITF